MANNIYFLKITGSINSGKQREFQQTVQFIFNHLPSGCFAHDLSLDVFRPNMYHLFSMWHSEEAMVIFKRSNEYQLLKGSFQTLGTYESAITGRLADVQMFEVIEINY